MTRTTVTRTIDAPPEVVFRAVSDVQRLPEVVPDIVKVEILGGNPRGAGLRFRETRRMGNREAQTDLEVVEFLPHERVRMITESHGTVWDSVFTIKPVGPGVRTELGLTMDANAKKLLPRLINPLMKGLIQKGVEKQMDDVKRYCEANATATR